MTAPTVNCFAAHRALVDRAALMARHLASSSEDEADLLRLGATCVQIAAEQAVGARNDHEAIRAWSQCELGERQIRVATCAALRKKRIHTLDYDRTFALASQAYQARSNVMLRLRWQLRSAAVI
jgi:hypothetical protein